MRTTVRLPDELLRRAKRKAAADGTTLTLLLEQGLRLVLDAKPAPAKRVKIPISKATGGLLPGVDIANSAALQDLMDEDALGEGGLNKLR